MLARAGIATTAQLRALGSVRAYAQAKAANPGASLNLLWALEGALTGLPWQQVAREHRTSLLLALEALHGSLPSNAPILPSPAIRKAGASGTRPCGC